MASTRWTENANTGEVTLKIKRLHPKVLSPGLLYTRNFFWEIKPATKKIETKFQPLECSSNQESQNLKLMEIDVILSMNTYETQLAMD